MIDFDQILPLVPDEIMPGTVMTVHKTRVPYKWTLNEAEREERKTIQRLDWLDTRGVLHIVRWETDE